ncbi:MAG: sigma-70 family RNA polymerase sigma factor [Planctomycetaceae bacterium]|nr:sigma-70 family RNA polymerase sigma factor [Planctomycetaceae bacterium]
MLESLTSAAFDDPLPVEPSAVALAIPPTDGERLMRFQRYRDEGAFAQVVETHAKMVWGVCSQILRHQQDVEDAFQATFLILARKSGSIRATESAAGWIYRVAYRTALLAHSRRCRRNESQLIEELPSLDDQLSEIERNEVTLRLLEELNALPARYRQPLVLCYMEGRTRSEAALQMGVSSQTVKGLLARGTRLLRSRLIRRGIALSATMAVVNSAMAAAQASAAPTLVAQTASLGASFALKLKLTTSGIKGASLKGVAACALAEKGIIAMTLAAASKPAMGILGVCLAAGMLAVADAEPAKLVVGGEGGNVVFISTEGEEKGADVVAEVATTHEAEVSADVDVQVPDVEISEVNPTEAAAATIAAAPPADVPGAVAISVGGTPTAGTPEDVLVASGAPIAVPAVPAVAPMPPKFEVARDFAFAFHPQQVMESRFTTSSDLAAASGGSEAALKLEGEYWDLKAAGLKLKAESIALGLKQSLDAKQAGVENVPEAKIVELRADEQLTLAEVKLCEVNAQRVRDALEQRVKGEEQEQQTRIEMKKAMAAAADAQRSAMDAANEARRTATIEVKRAVEAAQAEAAEAAKVAAKALTIRTQAPAIVFERKPMPAPAPAPPVAPQPPQEVRFEEAPLRENADMAIVPKEELKRLLKLAETTEKLQEQVKKLEEERSSDATR